jgi:hypothetical protein
MKEAELKNLSVKELVALADKTLNQLLAASVDPVKKQIVDRRHADIKIIYRAIRNKIEPVK